MAIIYATVCGGAVEVFKASNSQKAQAMFVVIYKWKVKPEKQAEFREGWRLVTEAIRRRDGSLGARLHQSDDNYWVAYAQWPDKGSWESAWQRGPVDEPLGYHLMKSSLRRSALPEKPLLTMTLIEDCLHAIPISEPHEIF